uniref:Uncharacterized protein n=1 Tax=Ascaris lumbricoides TaxID=6252 RepID=A0A0M3HSM7_ASCLU
MLRDRCQKKLKITICNCIRSQIVLQFLNEGQQSVE